MSIWARNLLILGSVVACLALAARARADDLDRFKAANELKAQKLVAGVKAALAQSRTLERTDAARARELLRKVQGQLEDDLVLPERQRTSLLQQVRDRLRVVIRAARAQEAAEEIAAQKAAAKIKATQKRDTEPQGKRKGPSSVAKDYYDRGQKGQDAAKRLQKKKELGVLGALDDVDQAAANITEQRITQRFVKATEMRMKKLSTKEVALLKALNSVMSVNFDNLKFREVIELLQERTGQPIIIDEGSLKEAMVEYDDPVNWKVKTKITVRTILRKVLGDNRLTYIIKDNTILVVTPQKARDLMVVRTYPIADLLNFNPNFGAFAEFAAAQSAQNLISMIQTTVDPPIWQQGATIVYEPATKSLVIRAPAELHYSMGFSGR